MTLTLVLDGAGSIRVNGAAPVTVSKGCIVLSDGRDRVQWSSASTSTRIDVAIDPRLLRAPGAPDGTVLAEPAEASATVDVLTAAVNSVLDSRIDPSDDAFIQVQEGLEAFAAAAVADVFRSSEAPPGPARARGGLPGSLTGTARRS